MLYVNKALQFIDRLILRFIKIYLFNYQNLISKMNLEISFVLNNFYKNFLQQ